MNLRHARLNCLISTFLAGVGLGQPAVAVSNGKSVSKQESITAVTVSIYSKRDDCTGVKIAPNLILTSRHCKLYKSTRVIASDGTSHRILGYLRPIRRTIRRNERDLAILRIDGNLSGVVAEIADDSTTPQNGSMAWIAGLGGKRLTKAKNPLRKIEAEVRDRNYSPSTLAVRITRGGRVCEGDSGGPGYTEKQGRIIVWGIDSGPIDGRSRCSSREVYAKVASEHDWIRKIIVENASPESPVLKGKRRNTARQ